MSILVLIENNKFPKNLSRFIINNKNSYFTILLKSSSLNKVKFFMNNFESEIKFKIIDTDISKKKIEKLLNNSFKDILSLKNFNKFVKSGYKLDVEMNYLFSDLFEKNQFKSFHNENFIKFLIYNFFLNKKKFNKIFFYNLDQFSKFYLKKHNLKRNINFSYNFFKLKNLFISIIYITYYFF